MVDLSSMPAHKRTIKASACMVFPTQAHDTQLCPSHAQAWGAQDKHRCFQEVNGQAFFLLMTNLRTPGLSDPAGSCEQEFQRLVQALGKLDIVPAWRDAACLHIVERIQQLMEATPSPPLLHLPSHSSVLLQVPSQISPYLSADDFPDESCRHCDRQM